MQEFTASRTALSTALMRALHTRADPMPLIDDPWGDRLVPASVKEAMRRRLPIADADALDARLRASPAYANVITRSRYAEDALAECVACGVRQAVLIGAGFDSYALRRPEAALTLAVFEIDHPATQALKRQRLADCAIAVPEPVHFIAADLSAEPLGAVLARSPFKAAEPAFFSWLGVTMYLTRQANLATLKAVADTAAPGSELVFSYVDQTVFGPGPEAGAFEPLQKLVSSIGEPFLSGFDPATLAQDLRPFGLELLEDLDDVQLVRRYDPQGRNALRPTTRSRVARVRPA